MVQNDLERSIWERPSASATANVSATFDDGGVMSAYDAAAPTFERHRGMLDGTVERIRAALLATIDAPSPPRLLDLGAGTGRIGWPFVAAGDDYVGVDLSFGMLREFARRAGPCGAHAPCLVQADGERLPFCDASFDAVMMMQVLGAVRNWRQLMSEAVRVLRSPGTLLLGHAVMPTDGLDARMKQRLALLLDGMAVRPYHADRRGDVIRWLVSVAHGSTRLIAAEWAADRTPRAFLDRQPSGAQFSKLPDRVKDEALCALRAWAVATFGSLDTVLRERHAFELRGFKFHNGDR
jgi:ubiquinone/menaquinone biosynthesis C-methylase UbiE